MSNETFTRLGALADQGFVVVLNIRAPSSQVITYGALADMPVETVLNARGSDDCLMNWLEQSVGTESFATIRMNAEDVTDQHIFKPDANGTAVSMLHNGNKVAALLAHERPEMTETEIKDAKSLLLLLVDRQPEPPIPTLGPRELAYLKKVSDGETDDEIAKELNLSMRSVKERKKRTITELGAANISLAIILAKKSGQL